MKPPRIVLDTNVLVAGLRSRRGTAYRLLALVGTGRFTTAVSVPLVLEYEKVLRDPQHRLAYTAGEIGRLLDYLCAVSDRRKVHFLWRPFLRDPGDDMVLELAVAAGCRWIVTFNLRDFQGVERFDVRAIPPREFLATLGVAR